MCTSRPCAGPGRGAGTVLLPDSLAARQGRCYQAAMRIDDNPPMSITPEDPRRNREDARRRPAGRRGPAGRRPARETGRDHRGTGPHLPRTHRQRAAGDPANVGYRGYPKTVCTSVNNVICHGIPSEAKVLKDGDIVNIDVTVIKDGWHGDSSRMYYAGTPSVMARRLVEVTREAMFRGIRAVKPGATLGDVGHAIQQYAEAERFSVVREYCGHGIGKVYHDDPQVLHYGRPGEGLRAEAGHDLHHRADDQRGHAATPRCCPTAGPWSPRTASCRRSGSTRSR